MLTSIHNVHTNDNIETHNGFIMQYKLPKIAKWNGKRPQAPIHINIFIKFLKTISLGIRYYNDQKKEVKQCGINTEELFDFINNKASMESKLIFYNTYAFTMTLGYVVKNVKYWSDVENNVAWQRWIGC